MSRGSVGQSVVKEERKIFLIGNTPKLDVNVLIIVVVCFVFCDVHSNNEDVFSIYVHQSANQISLSGSLITLLQVCE